MRWFLELPVRRKVLLFLSGGMLTLVFDAFIAHFSWNRDSVLAGMAWNQWIPIVYGVAAFFALGAAAVLPFPSERADRIGRVVGGLGMLVGTLGVIFHGLELLDDIKEIEGGLTLKTIGEAFGHGAPLFAPAAFAGVGLLLITLPNITRARMP